MQSFPLAYFQGRTVSFGEGHMFKLGWFNHQKEKGGFCQTSEAPMEFWLSMSNYAPQNPTRQDVPL